MFVPKFNFPEEIFSRLGHKVTKTCSCERERDREKQGRGNNSCQFSDQYFLSCFLCKHPTILFQNKN